MYVGGENVTGGSQEFARLKDACHQRDARMSNKDKPQIIRNCKKDIDLVLLPYQIEE